MDEFNVKEFINEQKEEFNEWKDKLKNYLSNETNKKEVIVLISKNWVDNYEKYFLNNNNGESFNPEQIDEEIKNNNNDLFNSFNEQKIKIEKFPMMFALSKNVWMKLNNYNNNDLNSITTTGKFGNKILILKVLESIYCIFFLDSKGKIKQGYLEIINKNNEDNIVNYFYQNGLGEYKDRNIIEEEKNYKITILNKENTIIKRRAMTYNNLSLKKLKSDEINFSLGSKEFYIRKKYKVDVVKEMGKSKNLFEKVLEKTNDNPQGFLSKINEKIIIKENKQQEEIRKTLKKKKKEKKDKKKDKNNEQEKYYIQNQSSNIDDFVSIEKLSTPGIIGLENIGATCYMNATLQCFSNIVRLRSFLIDEEVHQHLKSNKNEKQLSFALSEVLYHLWKDLKIQYYKPENFKEKISEMNPLFKGIAANDPKDLVLFLLETLHNELNEAPKLQMNNNYMANNFNFFDVFNEFFQYFNNENKSVISDEFYGSMNTMTTCGYCKVTIHNVQSINILFFPLEEIRKFKNYYHNLIKIEDCFQYYERQEIYPSCYCNNCRQLYPAYNQSKIIWAPPTLIINLNRGRGLQFNVNFKLEEYIDLKNYIFYSESPHKYELVGIICHYGSNDMGGHFIAYCKNCNDCQWYRFNDAIITPISFNQITGLPYVLFYSYII